MAELTLRAEAELNDECSAVTLTFHQIPLAELGDVMTAIGSPDVVRQYVDGVNAQIPIRRAGGLETRKRIFVAERPKHLERKGD